MFARAFDSVDYKILLNMLLVNWIQKKGIFDDEIISKRLHAEYCRFGKVYMLSGVPQGTILAAILFIIFVNNILDQFWAWRFAIIC